MSESSSLDATDAKPKSKGAMNAGASATKEDRLLMIQIIAAQWGHGAATNLAVLS